MSETEALVDFDRAARKERERAEKVARREAKRAELDAYANMPKPSREFEPFGKVARLSRRCVITEKIDGTNASVFIGEDGEFQTASRSQWITPLNDNHGFSRWAYDHKDELMLLGPGLHFGEWWGAGIQRTYGLKEKRFSLFNVARWAPPDSGRPECCSVVPILAESVFSAELIDNSMGALVAHGSYASPGFMKPEGIMIYHSAANLIFKKTIENDEVPKALVSK